LYRIIIEEELVPKGIAREKKALRQQKFLHPRAICFPTLALRREKSSVFKVKFEDTRLRAT
jgi:hypothetical protein